MSYAERFLKSRGKPCFIKRDMPQTSYISMGRATRAIRDYGAREAYWEGLIPAETQLVSGEVLEIDGIEYLIQSTHIDQASTEIIWFAVKVNTYLDHYRHEKEVDDDYNVTVDWVDKNKGIPAYGSIVTAELRDRDPGLLQHTRYIFQVQRLAEIKRMDRIIYLDEPYRVDSVDDIGMVGLVRIQVSEDKRA